MGQKASAPVVGNSGAVATSIFDFQVAQALSPEPISLSSFRGKSAYLVVNVASQ